MSTSDALVERLTPLQIESARKKIAAWREITKLDEHIVEGCKIVEKSLSSLLETTASYGFSLKNSPPIFQQHYAETFITNTILNNPTLPEDRLLNPLYAMLLTIYAFYFERVMRDEPIDEIAFRIMAYCPKFGSQLPIELLARVEAAKGHITTVVALDRQKAVRADIDGLTKDCLAKLMPLTTKIEGWGGELTGWEAKTNELKAFVTKQHSDLSFVGLSMAFAKLIKAKKKELWLQVAMMAGLAVALIMTIVVPTYYLAAHNIEYEKAIQWASHALPVLATEILLLYFFRISLRNYYSAKAQLLQLDLRYALCAFIEGYMNFKRDLESRGEDKGLEKFESLVFSGITADIQNIPSQFDGIDQLAALIKAARGKD